VVKSKIVGLLVWKVGLLLAFRHLRSGVGSRMMGFRTFRIIYKGSVGFDLESEYL
jgi:hypothetical protein